LQNRKHGEEGEKKKEIKSRPPPAPRAPYDPLAVRTIIVSGLPSTLDKNALWKKIRKCPGAETLTWPIKQDNSEEDASVGV